MDELKYRRILLKLGGESLAGPSGIGIDAQQAMDIARRLKEVRELGVDIAIVIGAGHLWRGKTGLEMGMDQLRGLMGCWAPYELPRPDGPLNTGVVTRVMTRSRCAPCRTLHPPRAIRHLEKAAWLSLAAAPATPLFHERLLPARNRDRGMCSFKAPSGCRLR